MFVRVYARVLVRPEVRGRVHTPHISQSALATASGKGSRVVDDDDEESNSEEEDGIKKICKGCQQSFLRKEFSKHISVDTPCWSLAYD